MNVAARRKAQREAAAFDPRPSKCAECGAGLSYGHMEEFGIRPFGSGMCYYCPGCGRYVATHKKRPKDALGVPGTPEERRLRTKCHEAFDSMYETTRGRGRAYHALAKALGMRDEDCHFGHMDGNTLKEALAVIQGWDGSFH